MCCANIATFLALDLSDERKDTKFATMTKVCGRVKDRKGEERSQYECGADWKTHSGGYVNSQHTHTQYTATKIRKKMRKTL